MSYGKLSSTRASVLHRVLRILGKVEILLGFGIIPHFLLLTDASAAPTPAPTLRDKIVIDVLQKSGVTAQSAQVQARVLDCHGVCARRRGMGQ